MAGLDSFTPQAGRQRIWKPFAVWEPVWGLASLGPLFRNPISAVSKYALILQTLPLQEKEQALLIFLCSPLHTPETSG